MRSVVGFVPEAAEARVLEAIVMGDAERARSFFAGAPHLDDPVAGEVRGAKQFDAYVSGFGEHLQAEGVSVEFKRVVSASGRSATEAELTRLQRDRRVVMPVALVSDTAGEGKITALRVYYRRQWITGQRYIRAAILTTESSCKFLPAVEKYLSAIKDADLHATMDVFAEDSYVMGAWPGEFFFGHEQVEEFYRSLFEHFSTGVHIRHMSAFHDSRTNCLEFNSQGTGVQSGEAGVAFYEVGANRSLVSARIYDETN